MPYMKVTNDKGQICVHKKGEDGKPMGKSFGCHDTEEEADKQIAAIYANEGDGGRSLAQRFTDKISETVRAVLAEIGIVTPDAGCASCDGVIAADETRAVSVRDVYARLYDKIDAEYAEEDHYPILIDVYLDQSRVFAVTALEGVLYRVPLAVTDTDVVWGDWERVVEQFQAVPEPDEGQPRARTLFVSRQADGRIRFTALACSAVLNRVGEIDGTKLFDNMARRAAETGQYPYLTFYHQGEALRMGQVDYMARDGIIYVNSGLFDETPLANAAAAGLERDGGYWGTSIRYRPLDGELAEIIPGVTIPVYTDGVQEELSILPERSAAALLTAIGASEEVNPVMNKRVKDDLVKLVGQEMADECEKKADAANERSVSDGMIARADAVTEAVATEQTTTSAPATEAVAAEASPVVAAEESPAPTEEAPVVREQNIETVIDDETILFVAEAVVRHPVQREAFQPILDRLDALDLAIAALASKNADERKARVAATEDLEGRLQRLERTDDEKLSERVKDLPARIVNTVTHRPRAAQAENAVEGEDDKPVTDLAKQADQALARLPKHPRTKA